MTGIGHNSSRRAFSLLETTIGMAILGIGLIMVAAIFPVALTQHRMSMDQSRAMNLVPQAVSMLHQRLNPDLLWYDASLLSEGYDSPWYAMPLSNIDAGGLWSFDPANTNSPAFPYDYMLSYTDAINSVPGLFQSTHQIYANDLLSDRMTPRDDLQANQTPNRVIWYGFYRQLGNGSKAYTAAVCKQRRDQSFVLQDLSAAGALVNPVAIPNQPQRFPVPWRVTATRIAGTNALYINSTLAGSITLAQLAPNGSKIMVRGVPDALSPKIPVPAGQVLTVSEALANGAVLVREDIGKIISDVDLWVFPPPVTGVSFGNDSPVLEWKVGI